MSHDPYQPPTWVDLALEAEFPDLEDRTVMTATTKELADILTGREYGSEITKAEEGWAHVSGLVVVFGASDDLMEFRGAIEDEIGAWSGTTATVDTAGVMAVWGQIDDADRRDIDFMRDYFKREGGGRTIEAIWSRDGYSWTFKTDLPHETFEIVEHGAPYCRGIVFALANCVATNV